MPTAFAQNLSIVAGPLDILFEFTAVPPFFPALKSLSATMLRLFSGGA